jgi:hypothetical protein
MHLPLIYTNYFKLKLTIRINFPFKTMPEEIVLTRSIKVTLSLDYVISHGFLMRLTKHVIYVLTLVHAFLK